MQPIETIEYRGFKINIYQDDAAINPREEFDHSGVMVCWHNNYILGDKHSFENPTDFREWLKENKYSDGKNIFVLPLYLYDHSGITMSTAPFSCPWDSGQVGYIYLTAERYKKEWGVKRITKKDREQAYQVLRDEVEEYDHYLVGRVYGYEVEPLDSNRTIPCDASCWGYYGDTEYPIQEAKDAIDYAIQQHRDSVRARVAERRRVDSLVNSCFAL